MRRLVMVMSRVDHELREGWEPRWFAEQLSRPWSEAENDSMRRVQGHWFEGFSEPHAFVHVARIGKGDSLPAGVE